MNNAVNKKASALQWLKNSLGSVGWPLMATLLGLVLGAVIILVSGENPLKVYGVMLDKSFINNYYLMQTLTRSAPIIVCAASAAIAWRAGYINLGMEGQMIVGGFTATVCALFMPGPPWLVLVASLVASCVGGAVYALIPTVLQWKCGISLIISTLMLNYVANYITGYFVSFPLKDTSGDMQANKTADIAESLHLSKLSAGSTFNSGFIIAILVVIGMLIITKRTVFGYESRMGGLNPSFAKYGGVKQTKVMLTTMALSGMLSGLAGFIEIFGVRFSYSDSMFSSTGYAWTGLMAALISMFSPLVLLVYSIFLTGLEIGGQALQRSFGLPLQIATIIQCAITLFVSINVVIKLKRGKRRGKDAQQPDEQTEIPQEKEEAHDE